MFIREGQPRKDDELLKLCNYLLSYEVDKGDIVRKELRDYLIDKIQNGNLANKKLTFKDEEELEYFSKLTNSFPIEANEVLEEIIMKGFPLDCQDT